MSLADRFKALLDYTGKNPSQFAKDVGFATPQTVREIIKGNTKSISDAVQFKIQAVYPEVNIEWLRTGEGEMLKSSVVLPDSRPLPDASASVPELLAIIRSQQETIRELVSRLPKN